jgi:hypothetical protein
MKSNTRVIFSSQKPESSIITSLSRSKKGGRRAEG